MSRIESVLTDWPEDRAKAGTPPLETTQEFPETLAEAKKCLGKDVVDKLITDQLDHRRSARISALRKKNKNGAGLSKEEIAKRTEAIERWTPESADPEERTRLFLLTKNEEEIRGALEVHGSDSAFIDEVIALSRTLKSVNPTAVDEPLGEDVSVYLFNARIRTLHKNRVRALMRQRKGAAAIVKRMKGWKPEISNRSSGAGAGSPGTAPAPVAGRAPMTAEAHKRLEAELRKLRTEERPAIVKAIAAAREHGDLSENAEYHAARERQGFVEGRIRELEDKLGRAQVIDVSTLSGDKVQFGATVTLADEDTDEEKTWLIVGADESDPKRGRLSVEAPLVQAMIGKNVGDSFTFDAPSGARSYEILAVEFR